MALDPLSPYIPSIPSIPSLTLHAGKSRCPSTNSTLTTQYQPSPFSCPPTLPFCLLPHPATHIRTALVPLYPHSLSTATMHTPRLYTPTRPPTLPQPQLDTPHYSTSHTLPGLPTSPCHYPPRLSQEAFCEGVAPRPIHITHATSGQGSRLAGEL